MTQHYQFPEIKNISDVLPHIAGRPEFIVVEKDYGVSIVNYAFQSSDTFPEVTDTGSAILRECRGLIFDTESGQLLSRRLSKFFNHGERLDTSVIDVSKPHQVLEKLDGSMLSPLWLDGGVRWCTKMGLTTTSMQAEVFAATHPEYDAFAQHCISWDLTPIFEWCSPENRIVVEYDEDNLILLAVRANLSGTYLPYDDMVGMADGWNIPTVKAVSPPLTSQAAFEEFEANVRAWEGVEGVVLTWDNGTRVKIKAQSYISLHRAKAATEKERDVVGLILDDKADDLMPLLPDADKTKLMNFQDAIWADIADFVSSVEAEFYRYKSLGRKEFALLEGVDQVVRATVFSAWNDPHPAAAIWEHTVSFLRKNLSNKAAFENKARGILKTAKWNAKELQNDN